MVFRTTIGPTTNVKLVGTAVLRHLAQSLADTEIAEDVFRTTEQSVEGDCTVILGEGKSVRLRYIEVRRHVRARRSDPFRCV